MGERIGVARAARLLGVDRHALQQMIFDGKLECFEGQVDLEVLQQSYPGLLKQEDPILEQVRTLKRTAFGRRVREVATPDSDSLAAQVHKLTVELSMAQHQHQKYQQIVEDMVRRLNELRQDATLDQRMLIIDLCCWLSDRLDR